jgi:pullulanase
MHRRHSWLTSLAVAFGVLLALFGSSAPALAQGAADAPRIASTLDPKRYDAEALLVVHYHRPDGNYAGWNLWAWPEGGDGASFAFEKSDLFGRYAIVPFPKLPTTGSKRGGFIVRRGNWEEKDFDQDRFVELVPGGVAEVWVVSGDDAVRTDPAAVDLSLRVVGAFLDASDRITLATTAPLSPRQLKGIAVQAQGTTNPSHIKAINSSKPSGGKQIYEIVLREPIAPEAVGRLSLAFEERLFDDLPQQVVYARDVLGNSEFTPLDATLGVTYTDKHTTFSTWSPVADKVELVIWTKSDDSPGVVVPMGRKDRGVWSTQVTGDLHGTPYRYRFTAYGQTREVPDMHCIAANSDSSKSVVVDLARLEPEGWGLLQAPKSAKPTDEIIYEVHVRDFSVRDATCPEADRGRYLGLMRGTPRSASGDTLKVSTGIEHLKELGITALHLLPVHDFTAKRDEYNWGYWTTLFNVPEANYASDPSDPTSPIRELRTAIAGLHRAGIRVILDVVYNHTSDAGPESPFGAAVPYYFFRTTRDGRLVNDTGVGNTIADERPMMRKFMVDSLLHWVRHYRVDGFRFDLLGCHEPATVRMICETLLRERSDLTLYGEPWTGGGTIRFGKGAQRSMPIAVFNDHLRNAIRGDLDGSAIGFATGLGGDDSAVRRGIAGAIEDFATEPGESIAYTSAHDNLTLWDKIVTTQPSATESERRAMQKLALGLVLTSQGMAFLHGGCDFCRTKQGQHNSYNLGDEINLFDWDRKVEYADVFEYVAGLVRLRREHPAFRMADDVQVRKALRFVDSGRFVAFTIDGDVAGDRWKRLFVAYNDEPTPLKLELPPGTWTVVVDASRSGVESLATARGGVELPPYSMFVAHGE